MSFSDLRCLEGFGTDPPTRTHRQLMARGAPQWWLHLSVCKACGQHWLVAQEERMNDVYIMRKLDSEAAGRVLAEGRWPDDFDAYETLLRLGPAHGHSFRFVDASSTTPILIDLIGQRPSITDEELAALVHVSLSDVRPLATHARSEVASKGYPYPWTVA